MAAKTLRIWRDWEGSAGKESRHAAKNQASTRRFSRGSLAGVKASVEAAGRGGFGSKAIAREKLSNAAVLKQESIGPADRHAAPGSTTNSNWFSPPAVTVASNCGDDGLP